MTVSVRGRDAARISLTVDDTDRAFRRRSGRGSSIDSIGPPTSRAGPASGLAIADAIVRATNGRWRVDSSPRGGGARMAVLLGSAPDGPSAVTVSKETRAAVCGHDRHRLPTRGSHDRCHSLGQAVRFGAIGDRQHRSPDHRPVQPSASGSAAAGRRSPTPRRRLLVTHAVGNTAANRRLTFGVRGRARAAPGPPGRPGRPGRALAITTLAIGLLDRLSTPSEPAGRARACWSAPTPSPPICRFVLLRTLIARSGRRDTQSPINLERTSS